MASALSMDLPHNQNGDVDWNTLGNVATTHILGEVICASYVDPKYGSEKEQEFLAHTDWEFAYEDHGIVVFRKFMEDSSLTCFMGRGVIDVPLREIAEFVKKMESGTTWDKFLVEARYLKVLSESDNHSDYIGYQQFEVTQYSTATKRDILYYVRGSYKDGKYIHACLSIEDSKFPPRPDIPRIELRIGSGFVMEPYQGSETRTLVSYVAQADFKNLPVAIISQVLKSHPMCIHHIQKHFQQPNSDRGPTWSEEGSASATPLSTHPEEVRMKSNSQSSSLKQPQSHCISTDPLPRQSSFSRSSSSSSSETSGTQPEAEPCERPRSSSTPTSISSRVWTQQGKAHPPQQNPHLPHFPNGKVDWNTLGNICSAQILGEVLCASYVDFKHGQMKKRFQVDTDWKFSYEKHNIMVFRKRQKDSPLTCFMGRGVIDAPLTEVAEFLKNVESTFVWDKFLIDAKYLKVLSESDHRTDYIGHQYFEAAQCFITAKRDMLYYVQCKYTEDGKYVQTGTSVEDSDYPPHPAVPRLHVHMGSGFVLEPYQGSETKTRVNYIVHADFKGLPMLIMNQVLSRHPMAIHYIRRHFAQLQQSIWRERAFTWTRSKPLSSITWSHTSNPTTSHYEQPVPIGCFMGGPHSEPSSEQAHSEPSEDEQECPDESKTVAAAQTPDTGVREHSPQPSATHSEACSKVGGAGPKDSQEQKKSTHTRGRSLKPRNSVYQQIELPHKRSGEVDWNTLGNILTAHILGEVLYASYVDHKYGREIENFLPDTDWEFAYEEHGIVVLKKEFNNSPIKCFMGRGVFDLPMEEVVKFVSNIQSRRRWDKYLVDIREVKRFSETDILVHMMDRASECLVKAERDFLYYGRMMHMPDGKFVFTVLSVEHPAQPPIPGIVRAELRPGTGWVIEPYKGDASKTLVSYLAHLDLVKLPAIITNRAMRRQPMSLHRIRELLTPPQGRRWTGYPTSTSTRSEPSFSLNNHEQSSQHYDDPMPMTVFTGPHKMARHHSVPPDVDHHWDGSSHTHDATKVKLGVAASDSNLAAVAISDTSSFKPNPAKWKSAATTELLADSKEKTSLEEQQTKEEGRKGPVPESSGPQSKQDPISLTPSPVTANGSPDRDGGAVSRTDTMEFKVSEAEFAATLDAGGSNQNVPPAPVYRTKRGREETDILPKATFFIPSSSPGSSNRSSLTPPPHTPQLKKTFSNPLSLLPQGHEAPESQHQPVPVQTNLPPIHRNPPEFTSSQTDTSNSFSSGSYHTAQDLHRSSEGFDGSPALNGREASSQQPHFEQTGSPPSVNDSGRFNITVSL